MGTNNLEIKICTSVLEAPDYKKDHKDFKHATLTKAIIVQGGTMEGKDTIDLQFEDEQGNKYMAMITAKLLKTVTDLTIT